MFGVKRKLQNELLFVGGGFKDFTIFWCQNSCYLVILAMCDRKTTWYIPKDYLTTLRALKAHTQDKKSHKIQIYKLIGWLKLE